MRPPYPVIDAHVHIAPWDHVHPEAAALVSAGRDDFEAVEAICRDPHRLIAYMDERNIEKLVMIKHAGHVPHRHVHLPARATNTATR